MKIREIPKIKLAVLAFYAAAILFMSACAYSAAAEAKEPDRPVTAQAEVTAAVAALTPADKEDNVDFALTEAEAEDTAEVEKAASYDRSAQYTATVLSDGDAIVGGTYTAEGEDESALEASGSVSASVTGTLLQKLAGGASSADGASFRGLNSGVRVYGNATLTLTDCEILAMAQNATGVFAYENGAIYMDNCVVNVTGGGAGGVQVAGGGTLIGTNLTVTSASKAAIRSDRGGGILILDGGTYTSTGANGCPAIYSTADITVSNAICIRAEQALSFNGGSYAIKAPQNGVTAGTVILNSGHFSIDAANSFDPAATLIQNGGVVEAAEPAASAVPTESNASIPETAQNAPAAVQAEEGAPSLQNEAPPELPAVQNGMNQPAPESSFDGQVPEMPGFGNQQPPEMPNGHFEGQQPQIPGDMQQPGQQSEPSSAGSPTEVAAGTMTNNAASLEADYDNATYITVTDDDSQVTIKSSGTYVVTGSSSDGNITVKKGTTGVVLVLNDLDLTSTSGATVSVNKEAEVKIIISGTVTLTDNENPEDEYSADADTADAFDGAALKAKANSQVYVTGDGTLIIHGNAKNGVKAGDDSSLIFDGVTVNIDAVNDGINANYDLTLLSGNFTIAAGDDAIHADHILSIGSLDDTGPTIRVTESNEGLEGTVVNIYGGDISIVSADDAINAANGDGLYEGVLDYSFNMMGGRVVINSRGDGVDSNGNVNLIGGSMEIHSASQGGEAGIDYEGQLYVGPDFNLNNQSGTEGPDGMPGQMPGDMGGQQPGQGQGHERPGS